jgi:hypothetical protein
LKKRIFGMFDDYWDIVADENEIDEESRRVDLCDDDELDRLAEIGQDAWLEDEDY